MVVNIIFRDIKHLIYWLKILQMTVSDKTEISECNFPLFLFFNIVLFVKLMTQNKRIFHLYSSARGF